MKLHFDKFTALAIAFNTMALVLITGCAGPKSEAVFDPAPTDQAATASQPRLKVDSAGNVQFQRGDLLTVTFSGTREIIPPHEERIKDDGTITLPLIGSIQAEGKTLFELEKAIEKEYVPKYYLRLRTKVDYKVEQIAYSVLGEVRMPGPRAYYGITKLTQAIGAAGGLTDFAKKSNIRLTRVNGTQITVNYKKAVKDPKEDPQVFPGDIIYVERGIW